MYNILDRYYSLFLHIKKEIPNFQRLRVSTLQLSYHIKLNYNK